MRNQQEFVELVDRYRLGEAKRLAIGVSIRPDYSGIGTALVLAEGRGKCLRVRWVEYHQSNIAEPLACNCRQFATGTSNELAALVQLRDDLSTRISVCIREAIAISGDNEKKLLIVCIDDPGIWIRDYDGLLYWESLIGPALIAEQVGLPVIDSLPIQDLAGKGRGWPIPPLAWWLMFADRNRTIAETARVLIHWSDVCQLVWLPESDGLDDDLPEIRHQTLPGRRFESQLLVRCGHPAGSPAERDRLGAGGHIIGELSNLWDKLSEKWTGHPADCHNQEQQYLQESLALIRQNNIGPADILRSFSHFVTGQLMKFTQSMSKSGSWELVCGADLNSRGLLVNEINQQSGRPWFDGRDFHYSAPALDACAAALTGFMHADQMPVSVPWLTGCQLPRVAGRLTPGNPASFRRLVMEMGDTRPPVMKLREAV